MNFYQGVAIEKWKRNYKFHTFYGANRLFCYDVRVSRAWLSIELWNQPVCAGDLSSESPLLQSRHLPSFFMGNT